MLEIFIIVLAAFTLGVVLGGVILKYWEQISYSIFMAFCFFIISPIMYFIDVLRYILLYILVLPLFCLLLMCITDEKIEELIVRYYDKMLHETSSPKKLAKNRRVIRAWEKILQQRKETEYDKQVENILEEAKWVL